MRQTPVALEFLLVAELGEAILVALLDGAVWPSLRRRLVHGFACARRCFGVGETPVYTSESRVAEQRR